VIDEEASYEGLAEVEEAMIDSAVQISLADTTIARSSVIDTLGTNDQDQSVAPADALTDEATA